MVKDDLGETVEKSSPAQFARISTEKKNTKSIRFLYVFSIEKIIPYLTVCDSGNVCSMCFPIPEIKNVGMH